MGGDNGAAPSWAESRQWGKRFLKVPTDAICELGLVPANVLIAVLNRLPASPHGLSMSAVAIDLHMSWHQVRRHLITLEERGYIVIERDVGKRFNIRPSDMTSSKMLGVPLQNAIGPQIQTPSKMLHLKEEKERSKEPRAASPACAASPPDDGQGGAAPFAIPRPGIVEVGARRPLEEIGDLLRVARRPSATEDVIPIAAQVERETKKRRDDEWARANGFVKIGGKGPLRQREIDRRLEGL